MKTNKEPWPVGIGLSMGSRWTHRQTGDVGEVFAGDACENFASLRMEADPRWTWTGTRQQLDLDWIEIR